MGMCWWRLRTRKRKGLGLARRIELEVNPKARAHIGGPESAPRYLDWIRMQPCAVCGSWGSEAHHAGHHGYGEKASDWTAIPLCAAHHRTGPDAIHQLNRVAFEAQHGVSVDGLIAGYQGLYGSGLTVCAVTDSGMSVLVSH